MKAFVNSTKEQNKINFINLNKSNIERNNENLYNNNSQNLNFITRLCGNPNPNDTQKLSMEIDNTNSTNDTYSYTQQDYINPNILNTLNDLKTPIFIKYSKQIPKEYILDIWQCLKECELEYPMNYEHIRQQKDINEKMRAILVDWLVEVHYRFSLQTETLFLTINIIDSYLSQKHILRTKFQLLGVTSLLIACKYEEIFFPDLKDFVYITDKSYSKNEILLMEREILNTLQFNVTIPSPLRFFEIIALNYNFDEIEFTYGKYLLESFLIDPKKNKYLPSVIALAVGYIIMKICNYANYRDIYALINDDSGYTSKHLKECAKEVYFFVQNSHCLTYKAVFNKYSKEEYYNVSHGIGNKQC